MLDAALVMPFARDSSARSLTWLSSRPRNNMHIVHVVGERLELAGVKDGPIIIPRPHRSHGTKPTGASATDDRRPVFQRMLDQAREPDRRFDVILVHAFSRFYRNGAEMELTIRSLRKLGVEVVSITQPTGDDPSQELMRQIIGIFDEYTSKENGKNVTRAMRESAKQGFWNGSTPPLGYRVVEADRRGAKIKKRLEIDPVEAETVRLIYKLYTDGDGTLGLLGVKQTTSWLNRHGYRTRLGAHFGVGPLYLSHPQYATGRWRYGIGNKRTGILHGPASIVEIAVPTILSRELFEQVQRRLSQNSPKITAPRIVNGPTLLAGLARCAASLRQRCRPRERCRRIHHGGGCKLSRPGRGSIGCPRGTEEAPRNGGAEVKREI